MASSASQLLGLKLTPHKISVCILARFYFQLRRQVVVEASQPRGVDDAVTQLGEVILSLRTSHGSLHEPTLLELDQYLGQNLPAALKSDIRQLWHTALIQLDSPDSLFDMFIELKDMLRREEDEDNDDLVTMDPEQRALKLYFIGPESPMGILLRTNILLFNDMSFSKMLELYEDVVAYALPLVLEAEDRAKTEQEEMEEQEDKRNEQSFIAGIDRMMRQIRESRDQLLQQREALTAQIATLAEDDPNKADAMEDLERVTLELNALHQSETQLTNQKQTKSDAFEQRRAARLKQRELRRKEIERAWKSSGKDADEGEDDKSAHEVSGESPSSQRRIDDAFALPYVDDTQGEAIAHEFGFASLGLSGNANVRPHTGSIEQLMEEDMNSALVDQAEAQPNYLASKLALRRRPRNRTYYSRRDLQTALHALARSLSRRIGTNPSQPLSGSGPTRSIAGLMRQLETLAGEQPLMAAVHYVKYLAAVQQRNYTVAQEALHAYFDAAATQAHRPRAEDPLSAALQYAALGLAHLHLYFGHIRLALTALHEALKTAQRAQDHVCLSHVFAAFRRAALFLGDHVAAARLIRSATEAQFTNAQRARQIARLEQERRAISSNTFAARALDETIQELAKPRAPTPGIDVASWIALAYSSLRQSPVSFGGGSGGGGGGPHGALSYFVLTNVEPGSSSQPSSDRSTTRLSMQRSVVDLAAHASLPSTSGLAFPTVDPAALTSFTDATPNAQADIVARPAWTSALAALRQAEFVASEHALLYPNDPASQIVTVTATTSNAEKGGLVTSSAALQPTLLLTRAEIWLAAGFPSLARAYVEAALSSGRQGKAHNNGTCELQSKCALLLSEFDESLAGGSKGYPFFSAADALSAAYLDFATLHACRSSKEDPLPEGDRRDWSLKSSVPRSAKEALRIIAEYEASSGGLGSLPAGLAASSLLTPGSPSPLASSARYALAGARIQAGLPVLWGTVDSGKFVSFPAEADIDAAIATILRYLQLAQQAGDSRLALEAIQTLLDVYEAIDEPELVNMMNFNQVSHFVPVDAGGVTATSISANALNILCVAIAWSDALGQPQIHAELLLHLASAFLRLGVRDQALILLEFLYSPVATICPARIHARLLILWSRAILMSDPGDADDDAIQRLQFAKARFCAENAMDAHQIREALLALNPNVEQVTAVTERVNKYPVNPLPAHLRRRLVQVLLLCKQAIHVCDKFMEGLRSHSTSDLVPTWSLSSTAWNPKSVEKEAWYVIARVCEELGMTEDRDVAAEKFVRRLEI